MLEYEENYFNYLKNLNYSNDTIKDKKRSLKEFEIFLTELLKKENKIKNFTKENIISYYNYLKKRKSKRKQDNGKNLSLIFVLNRIYALKYYFDYLVSSHKIIKNPFSQIELPIYKKNIQDVNVNEEDITKIISIINTNTYLGFRDKVIIELIYSTGLRRNEVSNLSIYNIDFNESILRVKEGKGKRDRLVPLGEVIKSYLKEYIVNVRKYFLSLDDMYIDTLFLSVRGKKLLASQISIIVNKYVKKAGIDKKITAHSLRHAFATHMMRKGCDIRYIQELLGHKFLSTTTIYTNVVDNDLREKILKYHPRDNELYDEKELNKLKIICKKR
jgi:integrase/recombinase XerD